MINKSEVETIMRVLNDKFGVSMKPFANLTPEQTMLLCANLLKREDLTDLEKTAVLFSLVAYFTLLRAASS